MSEYIFHTSCLTVGNGLSVPWIQPGATESLPVKAAGFVRLCNMSDWEFGKLLPLAVFVFIRLMI